MGNTATTIIAIVITAVLVFVFPVVTMADRVDTVSQTDVENLTTEFVNKIRTTGKLTQDEYDKFVENLYSTGNTYDVEMEIKIIDENPGKKTSQTAIDKIGENNYYSIFTTQILDKIKEDNGINLKEGDMVFVTVRNTNLTLAQQMKNFFYKISGSDVYTITTSQSGLVITSGQTK